MDDMRWGQELQTSIYMIVGREPVYDDDDQTRPEIEPGVADRFGWQVFWEDAIGGGHRVFDSGPRYWSRENAESELREAQTIDSELAALPLAADTVDRSI